MAYLRRDPRTKRWSIGFRYLGQEFHRSCRTKERTIAARIQGTVEETLDMLETGRVTMPVGVDTAHWILTGGTINGKSKERTPGENRLCELCDAYLVDQRQKASSTKQLEEHHIRTLKRILGDRTKLSSVSIHRLKRYVDRRTREKHRGKPISETTVRKELVTFRQVWVSRLS